MQLDACLAGAQLSGALGEQDKENYFALGRLVGVSLMSLENEIHPINQVYELF